MVSKKLKQQKEEMSREEYKRVYSAKRTGSGTGLELRVELSSSSPRKQVVRESTSSSSTAAADQESARETRREREYGIFGKSEKRAVQKVRKFIDTNTIAVFSLFDFERRRDSDNPLRLGPLGNAESSHVSIDAASSREDIRSTAPPRP